jgi:uncharacterized phiE125 gp8 family phage protein
MSSLVLYSAPGLEPVSVEEAKLHLRLQIDDDNAALGRLIAAARQYLEGICWRAFIHQTWDLYLDEFPDEDIELAKGTLSSVTSITYVDDDGNTQTLATTEYLVDAKREPGRIALAYGKSWPSTREQYNAVAVRFVVGYGALASSVPDAIKQAILILVADLYGNRASEVIGTISAEIRFSAHQLVAPYRLMRFSP